MKKTIIAFLMIAIAAGSVSAQYKQAKNAEQLQHSLTKYFSGASVTFWETMDEFIVARIYLNDIKHDTLFAEDGTLYAVVKYITIGQLPARVSDAIKQNYGTDDSVSAMEISKPDGRLYYAAKTSVKHSILTIRVSPTGKIEVVKSETL